MVEKGFLMKNRLLVITPYVPRSDLNSGDLRFFSILKILSSSFEIRCFTPFIEESDAHYVASLENLGITVLSGQRDSFLGILRKERFSAVLFEFYMLAEYYLPRVRILQPKSPIIVDSVDVHYYRAHSKYGLTGNPDDLKKAEEIKTRELSVYRRADMVITVTNEDGDILKNDCPELKIRIIPNIHRLYLSDDASEKERVVFVGGFSHEPNVDAVVYFCSEVLPRIREKVPAVKVDIVGSNPTAEVKALDDGFINVTGYVPSTTPYLHNSYISIAPLRYGAGMKGKIGEAMAHGRPVVTTSVGIQGMGLTNRRDVMVSDTPEGFADAVVELIADANLYKTIQSNAIEHVKRFTEDAVGKTVSGIMSEAQNMTVKKITFREKTLFARDYAMEVIRKKT